MISAQLDSSSRSSLPRFYLHTLMNTLRQSFLPQERREIRIHRHSRRQAGSAAEVLLNEQCLGISIVQSRVGSDVEYLAIATPEEVAIISLSDNDGILPKDKPFRALMSAKQPVLAGFNMPRLSICLFCHLKYHVQAIDLSTFRSKTAGNPYHPAKLLCETMSMKVDGFEVDSLWNDRLDEEEHETIRKVCLRAWVSAIIIKRNLEFLQMIKPIETRWMKPEVLACLGRLLSEADILQRAKPTEISNDFSEAKMDSEIGRLQLYNSRFNTRIRASPQLAVILTTSDGRQFRGTPKKSRGKQTEIKVRGGFSGKVASVKVIGREGGTNTEKARDELLLRALQGDCHLRHSKFVRMLWFPNQEDREDHVSVAPIAHPLTGKLNDSQRKVVSAMVSARSLVVVHGPPGTGKTSTISSAAAIWSRKKLPTWIVAHSNVAVKNIAEKLASSGVDFKIIVSKEFYVEWHEHLYTEIENRLFRGDELPDNPKDLENTISATTIILSTLSMLSNPALDQNGMFDLVPLTILVVDEASQINVFEYMHVFFKFRNVMIKVCFFGDPKQLPPYGKDKAPSMQCIFDIEHLKNESYFLNIQYRMPHPLGEFISGEIYNNRLRSEHRIKDLSCIAFIDTNTGTEERSGLSWRNASEVRTIVHLVKLYYKDRNFCIITPYDAQRAAIERELQNNNLPWERVFNVDSFQGNEADIVLVSVVRGREPGFLRSDQRMSVMLTRCRRGLVIVSSRGFLSGPGQSTLVGKLARGRSWIEWTAVAEQRVNLPDANGKHASLHNLPATYQSNGTRPNFDVRALFRHPGSGTASGTRTFSAVAVDPRRSQQSLSLSSSSIERTRKRPDTAPAAHIVTPLSVPPTSAPLNISGSPRPIAMKRPPVNKPDDGWTVAVGRKAQASGWSHDRAKKPENRFAPLAARER